MKFVAKLIALIALCLIGYSFVVDLGKSAPEPTASKSAPTVVNQSQATAGKIKIVSISCTAKTSHTDVDATIQNIGTSEIKFPALFVRVAGEVKEGIAQPMTLPEGAFGSVSIAAGNSGQSRGTTVPCDVVAAQDSRGSNIL